MARYGVLNESLFYRFPNNGERFIQFQNEGNKFFNLSWDRDSVTFQFVNYLGRSRITFANEHDPLVFEVIPDKFNYKDERELCNFVLVVIYDRCY